ncbi:MAG: AMP-binding protein [Actinobacteria bacterium]|nr:AMP-binding protein [Actinomycetota bacterium]
MSGTATTSDWSFPRVWDAIAAAVPDRVAVACGPVQRTYGELADRAGRLASHLHFRGIRPGAKVAIDLVNRPEYLEVLYGALLLGAVPVNVNYRYGAGEIAYLLRDAEAEAVVTEAAFLPAVLEAVRSCEPAPIVLEVGDDYEAGLDAAGPDGAWRDRRPSGDDLLFLYTGGTTGMPKGVMWRTDDLYVALWQMGRPGTEPPDPVAAVRAGKQAGTALPACPLMHGTGLFITLSTLAGGGTVVLIDRTGLDPELVWGEVERNRVQILTIVGDAFARPLLSALDATPDAWDLCALRAITSSGVTWSPETKRGLLAHLPEVTLLDSLGASEGLMSRSAARAGDGEIKPARFAVNQRVKVLSDDGREVEPGSDEVGMVGVGGRIPLGYYRDPEKTAQTFRTVGGVRYSIPGDYATVDADGTIRLLGRGSATVNTGGEKVYPEEVELTLRQHADVFDCVVVGVPDERFGEKVVALVQPVNGDGTTEDDLRAWCRERGLAGYKIPRRVIALDTLLRAPNGKADYRLLREIALERLAAPEG